MMCSRDDKILVWLPSPMGDAIMSTPALRAIRQINKDSRVYFLANEVVREVLSPSSFCDGWILKSNSNLFELGCVIRKHKFDKAILLKNSFGSALAVFAAGVKKRVGYDREMRGVFLTEKLHPIRSANGRYKPMPMIDYYLAAAGAGSGDFASRRMELAVEESTVESVRLKIRQLSDEKKLVILVPGGAFGPSKCWPAENFSRLADMLIERYGCEVAVSVSGNKFERKTAEKICRLSGNRLINLGDRPLGLGELKGLFSLSELVITNDTGPRHIAVALGKKTITLFGPNDPAWTANDFDKEIIIKADVPCSPCQKPKCPLKERICMESISVKQVFEAAVKSFELKN